MRLDWDTILKFADEGNPTPEATVRKTPEEWAK